MWQRTTNRDGVAIVERRDLAAMEISELSARKGALLTCPETRERADYNRSWCNALPFAEDKVYFRQDPQWLVQWSAVRSEVKRRRREHTTPVWTVVANVVREAPFGPGGVEQWSGPKHFYRGAKVYAVDSYWRSPIVIGRWRGAGKWTKAVVRTDRLENFRAKLAYDPGVIDGCFMHWGVPNWDESTARAMEATFKRWSATIEEEQDDMWFGWVPLPTRLLADVGGASGKSLHWMDFRMRDGRVLATVLMRHTRFHGSLGIDPEQVESVRASAEQLDWTWE